MIPPPPDSAPRHKPEYGTFSIVGVDPETREWGIAVAPRFLNCGYVVIWLKPEVGTVATQGQVNARL